MSQPLYYLFAALRQTRHNLTVMVGYAKLMLDGI